MDNVGHTVVTQAVSFASFAALAAQIWDWISQIVDEVEYLWGGRLGLIKLLYFVSRYAMLVTQIVNQAIAYYMKNDLLSLPECQFALVFNTISSQLCLNTVELILLIRVYALYNQSRKTRILLAFIFCSTVLLESIGTRLMVGDLWKVTNCDPPKANTSGIIIFGIGASLTQWTAFILTLLRLAANRQLGWLRTPLTSLMLREGTFAFIIISGVLLVIAVYQLIRNANLAIVCAAFSWYIALLSIAGSRLILNMRKLAIVQRNGMSEFDDDEDPMVEDHHEYQPLPAVTLPLPASEGLSTSGSSSSSVCLTTFQD